MSNAKYDLQSINGFIDAKFDWPDIPQQKLEEGGIEFHVAKSDSIYDAPAFFNPVMVLNRDISILFCDIYTARIDHKLRIIEPLAGIGLRGIRLSIELKDAVSEVVINDFDDITTKIANYNIHSLGLESSIKQFKREARGLLTELTEKNYKFHYLDLDPFGPPVKFLDSLWSVLTLSAIVSITATDMTALCGVYPKACLRKYGAVPLNNFHTHETAARILIGTTVLSAARQGIGISPIFTLSADHYIKVFFETRKGRGEANSSTEQIGYSYTCTNCMQIYYVKGLTSNKPDCCGKLNKAGPLWIGNIFNQEWCIAAQKKLLSIDESEFRTLNLPSSKRLLKRVNEGVEGYNLPGYYAVDLLSSYLKTKQPRFDIFKKEMEKNGYRIVQSQFRKQSFRTDASIMKVKEIFQRVSDFQENGDN